MGRLVDSNGRTDLGVIYLWEQVQAQAARLKLEIKREGPHFQVYPTREFMGERTASPGGKLTTGIATLEGLCAFLAGIEAIIMREEMIQSLIRVPEKVVEVDPVLRTIQRVAADYEIKNDVRSLGLKRMVDCLQEIFDVLYRDAESGRYDPDKEWNSQTLEEVADAILRRGVEPKEVE